MKTDIEIAEEMAAKRAEELKKAEEAAAAKKKEEEVAKAKEDPQESSSDLDGIEIELSEDTLSEVEKEVLAANNGKAKEELTEEIEAAKKERLKKIKEDKADYLKKYKEIASLEENEGKTDEEIQALVDAALEDASDESEEESDDSDDPLKDFSGLKDTVKDTIPDSEGKEVKLPDDVKSELEEYRSLKEDKVLAAFLEAKKAGTTKEFVDEFRNSGLHINIKEIPPKQIYQWILQNMKAIDSTITDEEIAEKVEAFEDMDKFERAQITAPLYSQMEEEQKAAREAFFGKVTETASNVKTAAQEQVKQVESELKSRYEGNTVFGVQVTPEVTEKMLSKIRNGEGIRFTDSNGKVDIRKTIEAQLLYDHFDEVKSAIFSRGQKMALRKETAKRGKPNLGFNIKAAVPSTSVSRQKKQQSAIEIAYGKN